MRQLVYQWDAGQEKHIWRELVPWIDRTTHTRQLIDGPMVELLKEGDIVMPHDCVVGWQVAIASKGFTTEPVDGSAFDGLRLVK